MTETAQLADDNNGGASGFGPEVAGVLQSLRLSIAEALAGIGDFAKPADIFKVLQLDRTLSRQLYLLASTSEPVGNGGIIPSRTSIERFLNAARTRGASARKIAEVDESYRAFEKLVQTHAGDRTTFNSMVAATGGIDDDWLAGDLRHRRNAFRAMSHALGIQIKTRIGTYIVNSLPSDATLDVVFAGASVGIRVLRALPNVPVFGVAGFANRDDRNATCGPIGLSSAGEGYIIEEFSSSPLPKIVTCKAGPENDLSREIYMEDPVVGNVGSSTLMYGSVFENIPVAPKEPLRLHIAANQPCEKMILDVLLPAGSRGNVRPSGSASIGLLFGTEEKFGASAIQLLGKFEPEYVGRGSRCLATLDVPGYADMVAAVGRKRGLDLDDYEAWRLRVDFPLFQSTVSIAWR